MTRNFPLLLLVAATLGAALAGCVDADAGEPASLDGPGSTLRLEPGHADAGRIEGVVTDDELRPLERVQVVLVERNAQVLSDASGAFRFEDVPAGVWTLNAAAPMHAAAQVQVRVEARDVESVQLRLPVLASLVPHHVSISLPGHFDCAAEYLIITGDCWLGPEAFLGQPDPLFDNTYAYALPVGERWESVVMELVWSEPANNQLEGMRLYLENGNGTEDGHSYKVGRVNGDTSPIGFVVNRGEPHPRADVYPDAGSPAVIPTEGEDAQVRVFPMGRAYEHTSQVCGSDGRCFLGIGIGFDIRFEAFATVFYNERAPQGFTGIPDDY